MTAVFDVQTPLHFGVGLSAGALGVDPHVATLAFITARVIGVALNAGLNKALFVSEHGQTAAKEIADLAVEVAGIYVGKLIRDRYRQQPAASPPPALTGLGQLAPGSCADGSGNWLPMPAVGSPSWVPVCPSSPWYAVAVRAHELARARRVHWTDHEIWDQVVWDQANGQR